MSIERVWRRGLQMAQEFLHEHIMPEQIDNLLESLRRTEDSERALLESEIILWDLDRSGAARAADFAAYNTNQRNLAIVQTRMLVATRQLFGHRPDVLSRLPVKATKAPVLRAGFSSSTPRPGALGTGSASGSVSGFGNPAAAAAAPAAAGALAPWMIVAIVITSLVTLGVLAIAAASIIGLSSEAIRDVLVNREDTKVALRELRSWQGTFDACMSEGSGPERTRVCAGIAGERPHYTPRNLPPLGGWITPLVIGIVWVTAFAGAIWVYNDIKKKRVASSLSMSRSLLPSITRY